jgi:hypothetical protein
MQGEEAMATRRLPSKRGDSGVALILVLLAILVLTTLAAAMVFSARTETLASYNYRVGTQAEYVARAGVQAALNFLKCTPTSAACSTSPLYVPLPAHSTTNPGDPSWLQSSTYYTVATYQNIPVPLYYTLGSKVVCCGASSTNPVVLGATTGSSNYPPASATNNVNVVANWIKYVNTAPYNTISDGLGGSGTFTVTATLIDYHTVNDAVFGVDASGCTDPMAPAGICRIPNEVWLVKSTGTWNSNIGSSALPTVVEDATIAPMYLSYYGNALYGLCGIQLNGTVCTDAYNSNSGQYYNTAGTGGTSDISECASVAGGGAGGSTGNAQPLGAGIGSNGGVSIAGGSYSIGGNVTYANQGTSSSCNTGFSGSTSGVAGSVLPGPAIPPPPDLTAAMTGWGYATTAPAVSPTGGGVSNVYLKANTLFSSTGGKPPLPGIAAQGDVVTNTSGTVLTATPCPTTDASGNAYTAYIESYVETSNAAKGGAHPSPAYNSYDNYTCIGVSGAGTGTSPYLLGNLATGTSGNKGTINIVGPNLSVAGSAAVVAMNSIAIGGQGTLNTSNVGPSFPAVGGTFNPNPVPSPVLSNTAAPAFVMDVFSTVNLGGQANLNVNPLTPGVPSPMFLTLNIEGTGTALSMTGQALIDGTINIPNGDASLGGSGASGALYGSILAQNISDGGNYPVHYDIAAKNLSGQVFTTQVVSSTRPTY